MSARSEEVFIYLRAFNAAKTKRDIEGVAKAVDKLKDNTEGHTGVAEDNTVAVEDNTKAHKANADALEDESTEVEELNKKQKKLNTTLIRNAKSGIGWNNRLWKQRIRQLKDTQTQEERTAASIMKIYGDAYKENIRRDKAEALYRKKIWERSVADRIKILRRYAALEKKQRADELKAYNKQVKEVEKAQKRMGQSLRIKRIPSFSHPMRLLKYATIIFGVLDLLPIIGTALNASLAGAIASVNGLMPIVMSFLGVIPAGITSMTQFGIVATSVFRAVGKELGSQDGLIQYWKDLNTNIQEAGTRGIVPMFRDLTKTWVPILNKKLVVTAKLINLAMRDMAKWTTSKDGVELITDVLNINNRVIENIGEGLNGMVRLFLRLAGTGGHTLQRMTQDLGEFLFYLDDVVKNNQDAIAGVFNRGYNSFKRGGKIIGRFIYGLYNIFKLSAPLTKWLADNLDDASRQLLKWTQSKGGIKAIKDYFADMKEPLGAIGRLIGSVSKAIFNISRSPNFVAIMDKISGTLVPALEKLILSIDGRFIDLVVRFIENLSKLADAGLVDALMDIGDAFVDIVGALTNAYAGMSDFEKKAIVWGIVLTGIFGGIASKIVGAIGKIASAFGNLKTQKALLAGMDGAGGGTTVVGGTDGKGKKGKKGAKPAGRVARATNAVGRGATKVGGGALAGLAGASIGAGISNTLFKPPDTAQFALATKNLDAFFKTAKGGQIIGTSLSGNVGTLNEAFARMARTGGDGNNMLQTLVGNITGATTPADQLRQSFANMDTALTNLPASEAAAAFSTIRNAAASQKIPMDQLVALFPQYADKVRSAGGESVNTAGEFGTAAGAASTMAGKVGNLRDRIDALPKKTKAEINSIFDRQGYDAANSALNAISGKSVNTYINVIRRNGGLDRTRAGSSGVDSSYGAPNRFAGGMANPGQTYMTGELGPEFTIGRNGNLGILGVGGPELYKPNNSVAVIPSSATFDPMGGNYGNAPDWARVALQRSINAEADTGTKTIPQSRRSDSVPSQNNFSFGDVTVRNTEDLEAIKRAVLHAVREAERDRRERR